MEGETSNDEIKSKLRLQQRWKPFQSKDVAALRQIRVLRESVDTKDAGATRLLPLAAVLLMVVMSSFVAMMTCLCVLHAAAIAASTANIPLTTTRTLNATTLPTPQPKPPQRPLLAPVPFASHNGLTGETSLFIKDRNIDAKSETLSGADIEEESSPKKRAKRTIVYDGAEEQNDGMC